MQLWQLLLIGVAGWMNRKQQQVIEYLLEENRVLRELMGRKRLKISSMFIKLEFTVNFPGFRRRLRRLTGVGFHPRSEFGLRAFGAAEMKANGNPWDRQDRFCMVSHQTIRVHLPSGLLTGFGEGFQEILPIHVIQKNVIPSIASAHHVVNGVRKFLSPLARHAQLLSHNLRKSAQSADSFASTKFATKFATKFSPPALRGFKQRDYRIMDDPAHAGGVLVGGGEEVNVRLTVDGLRTIGCGRRGEVETIAHEMNFTYFD